MLDEKTIDNAESQVRRYIEEEFLVKVRPEQNILDIFLKNTDESLALANDILKNNKSDLWVIVTSYYSMCSKIKYFWHARNF